MLSNDIIKILKIFINFSMYVCLFFTKVSVDILDFLKLLKLLNILQTLLSKKVFFYFFLLKLRLIFSLIILYDNDFSLNVLRY